MPIKSIEILNVMVFQRHWREEDDVVRESGEEDRHVDNEAFRLRFSDGINVLIGENGTGKTTVLKMIYAATQWSIPKTDPGKTRKLIQYFSSTISDSDALKNGNVPDDYSYYKVSDGEHYFEESLSHKGIFNYDQWLGLNIQSVFIPATEMLSHSKGFLAMNQKYNMPFDGTQNDIIVNASLPETREIPENMKPVLDKISEAVDGTVIEEDDTFYMLKNDGRKIEFSLEAEGLRKLGLIWKLIRNGLLETGSILLWDEPEANLNPELYPLVAEILLALQENGVQIFIATHSYNFAKYLEIRRRNKTQVLYHNLYKGSEDHQIYSQSALDMAELEPNHIMMADNKLLDEVYGK